MKNLVNDYLKSLDQFLQSSVRLGEAIRDALLPVIPDLSVYVAPVVFHFSSYKFNNEDIDENAESLVDILESVFNLSYIETEKICIIHFFSVFGVYLDGKTAQRVREILDEALNADGPVQLRLDFKD
jgi:hypothetical protein